jgi:hypothetical protein
MGNYFEDFTPGQTFKHWPGRTVTEFDNTWFTLMTMNTNPIHFDAAYAAKSQHGRCLVNGLLVIATVTGMSVKDISENAIAALDYRARGDAVVHQVRSRRRLCRDSRTQSARRPGADAAPPRAGAATATMSAGRSPRGRRPQKIWKYFAAPQKND